MRTGREDGTSLTSCTPSGGGVAPEGVPPSSRRRLTPAVVPSTASARAGTVLLPASSEPAPGPSTSMTEASTAYVTGRRVERRGVGCCDATGRALHEGQGAQFVCRRRSNSPCLLTHPARKGRPASRDSPPLAAPSSRRRPRDAPPGGAARSAGTSSSSTEPQMHSPPRRQSSWGHDMPPVSPAGRRRRTFLASRASLWAECLALRADATSLREAKKASTRRFASQACCGRRVVGNA